MTQRPHGIEGVGSMARSCGHRAASRFKIGIRMPEADADSAPLRLCNHFQRALKLGRNGHQLDVASRPLPESVKHLHGRRQQILRWMYSAARMTEKRPFEMNAQRLGATTKSISTTSS